MTKAEFEMVSLELLNRIAAACERTVALLEEIRDRGKSAKTAPAPPVAESTRQSGGLLKGSHLADAGLSWIVVHVAAARKAPDTFRSPWILDIVPVLGQNSFPLNASNTKILTTELDAVVGALGGRELILATVDTTNPQTGAAVVGLQVAGVFELLRGVPAHVHLTELGRRIQPVDRSEVLPWADIEPARGRA